MDKNTELVESAEQKAEKIRLMKNKASKDMLARKKKALEILISLANKSGTEAEKEAARYLSGGRKLGLVSTFSVTDIFGSETSVHEDLLFKHKKLGRTEMKKIMAKAEKAGTKISFDSQSGIYAIVQ